MKHSLLFWSRKSHCWAGVYLSAVTLLWLGEMALLPAVYEPRFEVASPSPAVSSVGTPAVSVQDVTVALLSSFVAKETTAGTLAVLFSVGATDHEAVVQALRASITPAGALAFIVASNLYIPCIASISVLRSELGSWGRTLALLAAMFALAMGMACAVYHIAVFV